MRSSDGRPRFNEFIIGREGVGGAMKTDHLIAVISP